MDVEASVSAEDLENRGSSKPARWSIQDVRIVNDTWANALFCGLGEGGLSASMMENLRSVTLIAESDRTWWRDISHPFKEARQLECVRVVSVHGALVRKEAERIEEAIMKEVRAARTEGNARTKSQDSRD